MNGHPQVKAICREEQQRLRRYRTAWKWLWWSIAIAVAAPFVGPLIGISPWLLIATYYLATVLAVCYYQKHFRVIPCPLCKPGYVRIFEDWICGHTNCYHKHTHTELPTRRTFLERCASCNEIPPAIICPDCRAPIILRVTSSTKEAAWLPDSPPVVPADHPPRRIVKDLR